MTNLGVYAKSTFAALMAVLTTLYALMQNGDITNQGWVAIAIAGVTAVGVYLFPNSTKSDNI